MVCVASHSFTHPSIEPSALASLPASVFFSEGKHAHTWALWTASPVVMLPGNGSTFFLPSMRCLPKAAPLNPGHCVNVTLAASQPGHCGATEDERGDCDLGDQGSWRIRHPPDTTQGEVRGLHECIAKCCACKHCNFVSISTARAHRECSWHRSCDLQASPPTGMYFTVSARSFTHKERHDEQQAVKREVARASACWRMRVWRNVYSSRAANT